MTIQRTYRGKQFGRVPAWRYRLKRFVRVRTTMLDGFRVLAYRSDIPKHVSSLLIRGDYEAPERYALNALLAADDRVLEIGSGVGVTAMNAARIVGSANVLAYEPNPAAAAVAVENFAANGLHIELRNRAVGAIAGRLDLTIGAGSWLGASSKRQIADGRTLTVAVDGIGEVMDEFAPSVVAMDVEGMETELLPNLRFASLRAIIVEFHDDLVNLAELTALRGFIASHGFALQAAMSAGQTEVWLRPISVA